ncbi:MAG: hypothetical protein P8Y10_15715 [Gemmatimonadales bacterium]|jgi:hypothetical protein
MSIQTHRFAVMALAACLGSAGCESGTEPGSSSDGGAPVAAVVIGPAVVLENHDSVDRFLLLFEERLAARIDLNFDPAASESWLHAAAGERLSVPLSEVPGWGPEGNVIVVYSWTGSVATPVSGGTQWLAEGWFTQTVEP